METTMSDAATALQASSAQLRALVEPLDAEQLRAPAYPTEWTVADVLSHMGSGADIFVRQVNDAVAGSPTPPDFSRSVWDDWNARTPEAQAAGVLASDAALLTRLEELTPEERGNVTISMGPFTLNFDQYLGLRLNEHVLHTWDVDVTFNDDAVIPVEDVEAVLDNLGFVARFAAKPSGAERTYLVRTSDPVRAYEISLTPEAVTTVETENDASADLELPAEAFIRLVYGRLDADHTPPDVADNEHLEELRKVFPGF
jgi:uncharacterized protein (TIGR03083 family)